MSLSEREAAVLRTIVECYIAEGRPVGSRSVVKQSGLNLSAASIRNTMADLTDKGYLSQPHTSAGRVPTSDAVQWYLPVFAAANQPDESDIEYLRENLGDAGLEMSVVLRRASRLLSSLSKQMSMVLAPGMDDVRFQRINFVRLTANRVLAVINQDGNMVQNRLVPVEEPITGDELVAYGNYINDHFAGMTLCEVRNRILNELQTARARLDKLFGTALALTGQALNCDIERDIFVDGALHILDSREFEGHGNVRELLRLVEERSKLFELLEKTLAGEGIKISFGSDMQLADLSDVSVISSSYRSSAGPMGVIGVIGPLHMDYARVAPLVDCTAKMLSRVFVVES